MTNYFEITGTGQTKFGELYDYSLEDLMFEATNLALEEAKMNINEIDAVIIGNMMAGELSNQSQLGSVFSSLYNYNGPVFRTEAACASGGVAIYSALQGLRAGSYDSVLVLGVEKMTDYMSDQVGEVLMQAASQEERDAGLSFPGLYALMAQAYTSEYGLKREELSLASYLMHKNGAKNPKAQFQKEFSLEQICNSPKIADPLRLLDCSPISDGAAAVVIRRTDSLNENGCYLVESQIATDCPDIGQRENQFSLKSTKLAMQKVLNKTKLTPSDISVVELHDCFSIALFMALEDMGFCLPGESAKILKAIVAGENKLVVNPSGGLKACGHPVGATGVKQIIEVAKAIKSTEHKYGMAHNVGGTGGTAVISLLANNQYF